MAEITKAIVIAYAQQAEVWAWLFLATENDVVAFLDLAED